MDGFETHAARLAHAATDASALERAYADYVTAVLDSPLWSPADPDGFRIPWRSAVAACAWPTLSDAFRSPGRLIPVADAWGRRRGLPPLLNRQDM